MHWDAYFHVNPSAIEPTDEGPSRGWIPGQQIQHLEAFYRVFYKQTYHDETNYQYVEVYANWLCSSIKSEDNSDERDWVMIDLCNNMAYSNKNIRRMFVDLVYWILDQDK